MTKDRSFGDRGTGFTPRMKKEFGTVFEGVWQHFGLVFVTILVRIWNYFVCFFCD